MKNGLITNAGVEILTSEQNLIINGNDDLHFEEGSGGMTVFLLLNLINTKSV